MLGSIGAADWAQAEGWREGLFTQCVAPGAPTPLPFGGSPTPGCRRAHSAGYVRGAAALAIICFITDFFGTLLTGLGLRSTDPNKKYKYYRVAIYALVVAGKNEDDEFAVRWRHSEMSPFELFALFIDAGIIIISRWPFMVLQ